MLVDWLKPKILRRGIQFRAMVEPLPDPESRVTLSDELDQLGMRRARVDWRLSPLVNRTSSEIWASWRRSLSGRESQR